MQCKDVPDRPILEYLAEHPDAPHMIYGPDICGALSILSAMPKGIDQRLAVAKMDKLIRRGLVDGCSCGCRGDFLITSKGLLFLMEQQMFGLSVEEKALNKKLEEKKARKLACDNDFPDIADATAHIIATVAEYCPSASSKDSRESDDDSGSD